MATTRNSLFARLMAVVSICLACALPLCARPYIAIFGSESCDDCNEFKAFWQENAGEEDPALVYVCIDDNKNYAFLKALEAQFPPETQTPVFPVFLAGSHIIYGIEAFRGQSEECLEWCLNWTPETKEARALLASLQTAADDANGAFAVWNATTAESSSGGVVAGFSVAPRLLFISSPGCQKCGRQQKELSLLSERVPGLVIDHYEFSTEEGQVYMSRVREHFGIAVSDENLTPLVSWGSGYVSGRYATADELLSALQSEVVSPWWVSEICVEEREAARVQENAVLSRLTWTMVLGAGLLDGINPCAFATIIFLVGYLLYLKRERRFVLAVGICFCIGVFFSYLLYGVSLGFVVDFLNRYHVIKICIYGSFGIAGIVLCVLHLRDALRYRRSGKATDMDMGLGVQTHRKIHDRIHRWAKLPTWLAVPAAVLLGCVISGMELACTGQVYLPTIAAMMHNGFHGRAFQMLLLYNVAFIVPLLAVTLAAYFGTGAMALANWAKDHVFATKIAMAVLFLLMAILMFWMI